MHREQGQGGWQGVSSGPDKSLLSLPAENDVAEHASGSSSAAGEQGAHQASSDAGADVALTHDEPGLRGLQTRYSI
jgi:hypothetical protein